MLLRYFGDLGSVIFQQPLSARITLHKIGTRPQILHFVDGVEVLAEQLGKPRSYCFTHRGNPIRWGLTNPGWHGPPKRVGIEDFRVHDLRHTWAPWHRQAGTSRDELKDLGGWMSRQMVDHHAKFAVENLMVAASRIKAARAVT